MPSPELCRNGLDHSRGVIYVTPGIKTYRLRYGPQAKISQIGMTTIVHLDKPDKQMILERVRKAADKARRREAESNYCVMCEPPRDVIYS